MVKIINFKTTRINLRPLNDNLSSSNAKCSNAHNNTTKVNEPFEFHSTANSAKITNPVVEKMFNFISTPQTKKCSGLYKDLILHAQLKNLQ